MASLGQVLLISPGFHGYWRSIERGFVELGYGVSTHVYDQASKAEKAWNKLAHELPSRVRGPRRHLSAELISRRALAAVRARRPDLVLVIRGDSFTPEFWAELDTIAPRNYLWIYDEIRRMNHSMDFLRSRGVVATYSRHDQQVLAQAGVQTVHVANAYDPHRRLPARQPRGDITFIGARLPRREAALVAMAQRGLPVHAVGREWSNHLVDRLRTFRTSGAVVPHSRDVALEQAWAIMRDSRATLNVHGDQDGFTMRTFEACGVGGVQLIDRADVAEYFEPETEVLVFSSMDELIDQARRALAEPRRMARLREAAGRRALAEHTFEHRAQVVESLWA